MVRADYSKSRSNELLLRQVHPVHKRAPKSKVKREVAELMRSDMEEARRMAEEAPAQPVVLKQQKARRQAARPDRPLAVCPRVFNQEGIDKVKAFRQGCRLRTDGLRKRLTT